jgi:hypothetical protein
VIKAMKMCLVGPDSQFGISDLIMRRLRLGGYTLKSTLSFLRPSIQKVGRLFIGGSGARETLIWLASN